MPESISSFQQHDSEADTCRKEVLPRLYQSKWSDEQILEQRNFTDGKIAVAGRIAKRKKAKRFDYLLRYSQNFPIAIVEAKRRFKTAEEGMQQAKDYASILGLKFAYATNGVKILEFDFITGLETEVLSFPTPAALWARLQQVEPIKASIEEIYLKPFYTIPGKEIRYYQREAINRAVKAILEGRSRLLLNLATGTGKTTVAFQVIYKLWSNRWNRKALHRKPKILFLADRSILVTDPHAKDFSVFGDARCLVPEEGLLSSREIYFSTYHSLAEDSSKPGAFRTLPRDFFDLIVIDECHRGSAADESNWRVILDYFDAAVQLGLTATPLREDNRDTYNYFGNPIYTYTLKEGIEDGFLAPYIVHRVVTSADATGFRPEADQLDDNGALIPDGIYTTPDFERNLSYLPRTQAVARHLYHFMQKNGRFDKTIVFCVNQEHADQFRRELSNLNADLVREYPDYAVRIVSEEGDIGKGFLNKFMDIDDDLPVIVTTSKLLSTGVDIPTCKNIVIFRMVNAMTEFKQIIGRGTRVRQDKDKLFFTILDYTGSATRKFADPEFDGQPPLIREEEIDNKGEVLFEEEIIIEDSEDQEPGLDEDDNRTIDDSFPPTPASGGGKVKYYISNGEVSIAAETVQIMDDKGKLRTVHFTQFVREQLVSLYPTAIDLKQRWMVQAEREILLEELENQGITLTQLTEITGQPEADPFDLLCFVAYDLVPLSRKKRADLLKKNRPDFFSDYSEKAREVLNLILEKYIDFGLTQIRPDIIFVDPIAQRGNTLEIVQEFGGLEEFKEAITRLQTLLYTDAA